MVLGLPSNVSLLPLLLETALGDELVEPPGVDPVGLEVVKLNEVRNVVDGGGDVPTDGELLEREDHVLGGRSEARGREVRS